MPVSMRGIGMAILRDLAPQGLPINAMIRILRGQGATYHNQTMRDDARVLTGRVKYHEAIKNLTGNQVVGRGWMVEAQLKQPAKYRVFGEAEYWNPVTNQMDTKLKSFYTNDLKKKEWYESDFLEYQPVSETDPETRYYSFNQVGMEHNKGWDY